MISRRRFMSLSVAASAALATSSIPLLAATIQSKPDYFAHRDGCKEWRVLVDGEEVAAEAALAGPNGWAIIDRMKKFPGGGVGFFSVRNSDEFGDIAIARAIVRGNVQIVRGRSTASLERVHDHQELLLSAQGFIHS